MKRRAFLTATTGVVLAGCSFGSTDSDDTGDTLEETSDEILTGEITERRSFYPIDSVTKLTEGLAAATPDEIVDVPPDVDLDSEGLWELEVPSGVTLDGSNSNGEPGAYIFSPESDETPEYNSTKRKIKLGEGATLTGFKIEGSFDEYVNPAEEHDGDFYAHRGGGGVEAGKDTEVYNNEISGWPYAAVFARGNAHIHHNYIHHNTWEGLGYGVAIPEGNHMPVIESNRFNYNRHSITGAGGPKVGYIARYNLVEDEWVGSQFDMHGTEGMEGIAGEEIHITRNTFKSTHTVEEKTRSPGSETPAIDIRGTPTEGVWVEKNWFYHEDRESALRQPNGFENIHWRSNHFGESEPTQAIIGAPRTAGPKVDRLDLTL